MKFDKCLPTEQLNPYIKYFVVSENDLEREYKVFHPNRRSYFLALTIIIFTNLAGNSFISYEKMFFSISGRGREFVQCSGFFSRKG